MAASLESGFPILAETLSALPFMAIGPTLLPGMITRAAVMGFTTVSALCKLSTNALCTADCGAWSQAHNKNGRANIKLYFLMTHVIRINPKVSILLGDIYIRL